MLKNYIVSYWQDTGCKYSYNHAFACEAENEEHAEQQCQNAYPGCFIAEVYLDDENY